MKARVLISSHSDRSGFNVHRVYLEPHFDQAVRDYEMVKEIEPLGKELYFFDCELFDPDKKATE